MGKAEKLMEQQAKKLFTQGYNIKALDGRAQNLAEERFSLNLGINY